MKTFCDIPRKIKEENFDLLIEEVDLIAHL